MADILYRLAAKQNLSFISPNEDGVVRWDILRWTVPPRHQFDLMASHAIFDDTTMKAYLRTAPFVFTVLREPLARMDSGFRYRAGRHKGAPDTWDLRLEHIATNPIRYMNEMARDLGWYDGVDTRRRLPEGENTIRNDHEAQVIADWIDTIDKKMDLVFLTEHYDEGLVLLKHKLGLSLDDLVYIPMKEAEETPDSVAPPTEKQLKLLQEGFLSVDTPLYEHFSKRFWREWEELGGDAKLGPELAELRSRNEKLSEACAEPRDEIACPEVMILDSGKMKQYLAEHGLATNYPFDVPGSLERSR